MDVWFAVSIALAVVVAMLLIGQARARRITKRRLRTLQDRLDRERWDRAMADTARSLGVGGTGEHGGTIVRPIDMTERQGKVWASVDHIPGRMPSLLAPPVVGGPRPARPTR